MKRDKFLTVMAVLDDDTQAIMAAVQREIISKVADGTQTMGIPFHITLGSYPVKSEDEVSRAITVAAAECREFAIELSRYNDFGNRVLYLEPSIPQELSDLRKCFESDFAGGFDWVPHATVFCGEEREVVTAKDILDKLAFPIHAKVVAIELGEFFPPRRILREDFK